MPNLIKLKNSILLHQKIIKTITFVLSLPLVLIILNLLFETLFNLGVYTGTFLRFLYAIVVY